MASAACSSTRFSGGELFVRPRTICRETPPRKPCGGDITASYTSFHSHLCVTWKTHLFPGKALELVPIYKENRVVSVWMNFRSHGNSDCNGWRLEKQCRLLRKAVATVEPYCYIPSQNGLIDDSNLWYDAKLDSQMESLDDFPDLDERERLRRMRISKANKGNIPWNKGRKHRPETVQKIRDSTRRAMQDPKVKMKLMNLGHAQSDETKKKIALGVRQGWERRRIILMVQERCLYEWQNIIAESSRKGNAGVCELQWDSYKIMDEQLKQAWLESIEKRKSMPRPKGSKRAPKSLEQRRKISEAISAKWADPEYRGRVHAALAKYHGTTIGVNNRKCRRKSTGVSSQEKKVSTKKPEQTSQLNSELKDVKQLTYRKRKNSPPSFKDPMCGANLELLKKIKAEREEIEAKKRAATMRAKLLIAEAERAAKALEVAALKSPLAKASLLETRKLIAEATLSINSIENSQLKPRASPVEPYFDHESNESKKFVHEAASNEQLVNGFHALPSTESSIKVNQYKTAYELMSDETPPFPQSNNEIIEPDLVSRKPSDSNTGAIRKKKWVCGRLVEVEE